MTCCGITPESMIPGAGNADPDIDTPAMQLAVNESASTGRPVILSANKTYAIKCPSTPTYTVTYADGGMIVRNVHVAVVLSSGVTIVGEPGHEIIWGDHGFTPADSARLVAFGTPTNAFVRGTYNRIKFYNINVDFRNELIDTVWPLSYAIGLIGVEEWSSQNLRLVSTGARQGRGGFENNCDGSRNDGLRADNIVQGWFSGFNWNVRRVDWYGHRVSEFMDVDLPEFDATLWDIRGKAFVSVESQLVDSAGGRNWDIRRISLAGGGNMIGMYAKTNHPTWESFQNSNLLWINDNSPFWIPENINIDGLFAENVSTDLGHGVVHCGSFRGATWSGGDTPPPDRITIKNGTFINSGMVLFNEGTNICVDNIQHIDPVLPDSTDTGYAFVFRQSISTSLGSPVNPGLNTNITNAAITGVCRDCSVIRSPQGGFSVHGGPLSLVRPMVDGYALEHETRTNAGYGVRWWRVGVKPGKYILEDSNIKGAPTAANSAGDIRIESNSTTALYEPDWSIRGIRAASGPSPAGGRGLTIGRAPDNNGSAIRRESEYWLWRNIPQQDTTAGVWPQIVHIYFTGLSAAIICDACIYVPSSILGNSSNYTRLVIQKRVAGVVSSVAGTLNIGDVNLAAGQVLFFPLDPGDADATLAPGEELVLSVQKVGTGSMVPAFGFSCHVLPFSRA